MHLRVWSYRSIVDQAVVYQMEILIALFVLLLSRLLLDWARDRQRNLPPGPLGVPILGYIPFMSRNPHLDFIELGKTYGSVFRLKFGSKRIVVLNEADVIKEGLTKSEIQGRDAKNVIGLIIPNNAFFTRDNNVWREQRRFVVHSMKDLGLGKTKIEDEIQEEISQFIDVLKNSNGHPVNLKEPLSPSMSNNICALVFGKRFRLDDPIRNTLDMSLETAVKKVSQAGAANSFPWLLTIPLVKKLLPMEAAIQSFRVIKNICDQEIENHKKDFDSKNVRDFIDSYLVEIEEKKNDPDSSFNEETLSTNVEVLFSAGSETVRTSILWCIYAIAAFPDVQKKVQQEIQDVMGSHRSPHYLDQKEMPYTHAVILEILRWKTIVPLNARRVTEDTEIAGYYIPKETIIVVNLWNVHHDPNLWDDPKSFKPERFLNSNGRSIVKPSNFIPFSLGKRACPGETMANMEMFLYFTSILQKFDVVLPKGEKADLEGVFTLMYIPKPFKVCFIPRT